ncbi:MAG: MBL fold metallo-hydrolase [Parcubacteria group bacterium]|nr:MBL fold metallo-hydrolase [Parcubacteria group bacterium]
MIITYLGVEAFKVQFGDIVLAFNPVSKESKFKQSRFGADIALVSLNDKDLNGVENLSHGDRAPFIVSGPGEYEIKDVFIKGFLESSEYGGKKRINTIYTVSLEGMNLCFLGALGVPELKDATSEAIDGVDILFVPIGGEGVLSPADAYKLAVNLQPKIIIPMHYGDVGDKNALKTFFKEGGEETVAPIDKLTIKKKDLEGKEGDIVVLAQGV